jgi:hypothetical protein
MAAQFAMIQQPVLPALQVTTILQQTNVSFARPIGRIASFVISIQALRLLTVVVAMKGTS